MSRTIGDMRAMAQRQLDGMPVNRDLMAKDVLELSAIVARQSNTIERLSAALKAQSTVEGRVPGEGGPTNLAKELDDLFKDIFKPRPTNG